MYSAYKRRKLRAKRHTAWQSDWTLRNAQFLGLVNVGYVIAYLSADIDARTIQLSAYCYTMSKFGMQ